LQIKAETDFLVISVAFDTVTSFLRDWSASELNGFYVFLENYSTDLCQLFFRVS